MTNEQLFDDLKQFIATTVSQQTADLGQRIDGVEQRLDTIETKMATKEDLAALRQELKQDSKDTREAIAESMDQLNDDVGATLKDHDKRIRRLEHKLA
jgi:predicted  nucleic acid-binding Zn-ribbon protein